MSAGFTKACRCGSLSSADSIPWIPCVILATFAAVLLSAASAEADVYSVDFQESSADYIEIIYHNTIDVTVVHDDERGVFWDVHTVLFEHNEDFGNDFLAIATFTTHQIAPHGERPNAAGGSMSCSVYGEDTTNKFLILLSPQAAVAAHESHADLYSAALVARLNHFLGIVRSPATST